jgi:hypothetical protein
MNAANFSEVIAAIQANLADQAQALRRLECAVARVEHRLDHVSISERRDDDHKLITDLLPIAFASFADREFTVGELVNFAALPGQEPLRAALTAMGRPKRIGRILVRHRNATAQGLQLVYVDDSRDGIIWRLIESQKPLTS